MTSPSPDANSEPDPISGDGDDPRRALDEAASTEVVPSALDTEGLESVEQPRLPGTWWSATWAGPVPNPSDLAAYNRVSPGLGDRLVDHWINEGVERRNLHRDLVRGELRSFGRGQWLGATLAAMGMVFAFSLGLNGHDALAGEIFGTTVVGIAAVFLTGRLAANRDSTVEQASSVPTEDN